MANQANIPWAEEGAEYLKIWCEDNGYLPFSKLETELKIPHRIWSQITGDFRALTSVVEAYAAIYLRTGMSHFDPRKLPPRSTGFVTDKRPAERAWTDSQYQEWLKNPIVPDPPLRVRSRNKRKNVSHGVTSVTGAPNSQASIQTDVNLSWPKRLSVDLKAWCENNGYPVRRKFARDFGIKYSHWDDLMSGEGYTNSEIYAKIFVVTGLVSADPRTVPSFTLKLPKGGTKPVNRAWTQEQFDAWLEEQKRQNSKPQGNEYLKPDIQIEEFHSKRPAEDVSSSDYLVQFVESLKRELKADLMESFGNVVTSKKDVLERASPSIHSTIQTLVKELQKAADQGKLSSTQFANMYGQVLSELFPLVEGFSLPNEKVREEFLDRNVRNQKKIEVSR